MSRIFTFGCSFTQYAWPTWADIIAYDKGIEYYNYAIAGLGNVGIFHRIVEADMKHNFTDDDEIYILWSSWSREDRIIEDNWLGAGSVLIKNNDYYNHYFMRRYWNFNNDIVKNSTAIISANKMYGNLIKWQASGFDMFTVEEKNLVNFDDTSQTIATFYKEKIPDMQILNCETENPFKKIQDSHPDIIGHLSIVKSAGVELKESTINEFLSLQKDIETLVERSGITKFDVIIGKIDLLLAANYKKIRNTMNYQPLVKH